MFTEIAKLTRVDKKAINNRTQDFITVLTDIVDEEIAMAFENVTDGKDEADRFINDYVKELEYKLYYSNHSYDYDVQLFKLLMIQGSVKNAMADEEPDNSERKLETWSK